MSNLMEKKPILSDADPSVTEEPDFPQKSSDNGVIKVALEVTCCPCPEPKECKCEENKCEENKCEECKCEECKCEECGCGCEKKEGDVSFCKRWFPMFSRTNP